MYRERQHEEEKRSLPKVLIGTVEHYFGSFQSLLSTVAICFILVNSFAINLNVGDHETVHGSRLSRTCALLAGIGGSF